MVDICIQLQKLDLKRRAVRNLQEAVRVSAIGELC